MKTIFTQATKLITLILICIFAGIFNAYSQAPSGGTFDGDYCPAKDQPGDEYDTDLSNVFTQLISSSPSSTCQVGTVYAKVDTQAKVLRLGMNIGNGGAALFRLYLDIDNNVGTGMTTDDFGGTLNVQGADRIIQINSNAGNFVLYQGTGTTKTVISPDPLFPLEAASGTFVCNTGGAFLEFNIPFQSIGVDICNPLNPGIIKLNKLASVSGNSPSSSICVNQDLQFGIPLTGSVDGSTTICYNGSATLTVEGLAPGSTIVRWESTTASTNLDLDATWTTHIPNTSTTLIVNDLKETTRYRAIFTNDSVCPGLLLSTSYATVTVSPQPTVDPITNITVCKGASVSPPAFSGSASSFSWTNSNTAIGLGASGNGNLPTFTATNATSSPISATITVTPHNTTNGVTCNGTPTTFTITVNPNPTVTAVTNQTVCNGASTTTVHFTGDATSFLWTNNTPSIGLVASGTGDISAFTATNAGSTPVTATITVTPRYTTDGVDCNGTPITFTITVNPAPAVDAINNQIVCNGASTTAVNFSGTATSYSWTNNTPSIGLAASGTTNIAAFTAINTGTSAVTATITVTPNYLTNGVSCAGTPKTFTITVNPTPTVNPVTNKTFCTGTTTVEIPFTGNATSFTWTNSNTNLGLGAATGNGNIPSFTATNSGTAPISTTIVVTPHYSNGGLTCDGTPQTFTITVNPAAQVSDPVDQVVCNGASTSTVNFTTTNTGGTTSYTWTNNNTSIGLASSGSGNIIPFTAVNATISPVTATIIVTPHFEDGGVSCDGPTQSFTITVNPGPQVNDPADQVICNGSNTAAVNFTTVNSGIATIYSWTNNNTSIGLAASGTGNIASFAVSNPGSTPVTATIVVTPQFANGSSTCDGPSQTFTITVNPSPTVDNVSNQTVCRGASTTAVHFTGTATSFNWTNSNTSIGLAASGTGDIGAFTATNTGTSPITATITVTPRYTTNGVNCDGPSKTFTITVNPTPTVNTVANQTVCKDANTTAITFGGTATSFTWSNNNTAIGLAANGTGNIAAFAATNTTNSPIIATITVTPHYTTNEVSCDGTPKTFTITVNPAPTVDNINNQTVCRSGSTTAVHFTGTATSFNWTNSNPAIGLAANGTGDIGAFTATNTGSTPITGTITVTPRYTTNGVNCDGPTTTFTITVNPTPTVNTVANQTVCTDANTTAITFGGTATSFTWSNTNTAIGLAATGTGNIAAFAATNTTNSPIIATITVTPHYTTNEVSCDGTPKTFTITVNPAPAVNPIENQTVCKGASTTAISFSGTATSFTWTNSNTAIGLTGNGTGNIGAFTATNTTNAPITGIITVTPHYSTNGVSCDGPSTTFTITVNPTPTVNTVANQTVCNEASTTSISFGGTATSFTWSNNNTAIGLAATGTGDIPAFTATNGTSAPISGTITVTPHYSTNGVSCDGTPKTFTITVNPAPAVNTIENQTVCKAASTTAVSFSGTATSFSWTNSNTAIGLLASGSGNIAAFTATNTTTAPISATITVTPHYLTNGVNCDGPSKTFTITVNPSAQVNDPANQVVCTGADTAEVNFSSVNTDGTTTYTWSNNNPAIGLAANGTGNIASFVATNNGNTPLVATIVVTPQFENGGVSCQGATQSFTITVNPKPAVTNSSTATICSGISPNITLQATTASTFAWTVGTITGGITGASNGTGGIIDQVLTNPSNETAGTVEYIVTPTSTTGECTGESFTITVTVNPRPVVTNNTTASICSETSPNITLSASAESTFSWTIDNVSANISGASNGNGPKIDQTLVNSSHSTAGSVTYIVTPTATTGSCTGASTSIIVTVNPIPMVTNANATSICSGTSPKIALTASAESNFTWTVGTITGSISGAHAGSGNSIDELLTNPSNETAGTVQYIITPTSSTGECTGEAFTITVTVNPSPTITNSPTETICSGTSPKIALTATTTSNFTWTVGTITGNITGASDGAGSTIDQILTNPSNASAGTVQYIVNPNAATGECTGEAFTITVTVNPRPNVNSAATATVCSDTPQNYNITATTPQASFSWSRQAVEGISNAAVSNQMSSSITEALINTTQSPINVMYQITPTAAGCEGEQFTYTVTVNPSAIVNELTNQVVCNQSPTSLVSFATMATGGTTTYSWTNDNPSIGLAASGNGNIDAFTAINTTDAPITATISVTPHYLNNEVICDGAIMNFTITVNPSPAAPISAGDVTACRNIEGIQTLTAVATVPEGYHIVWYDAATAGNIVENPTLNSMVPVSYYAQAVNSSTQCISLSRTAVALTINDCTLALTKDGTYEDTNGDGITNVGDHVLYKFVVTNTSNVPLSNITITDINAVVTGGPIATLEAGASDDSTFMGSHAITQTEIDSRFVYNLGTVTGTAPTGEHITANSTDPTPCQNCPIVETCPTCTITTLTKSPAISVTKDGTYVDSNGDNITNVGDVVSYVFVVKNTGNQTLTNVNITDDNAIISGGPIAELAVGQTDSTTFTGSHAITQQDIDKGFVYNLALAKATDPQGDPVTDNSSDPTPCDTCPIDSECRECTITPLTKTPSISVTKDGKYVDTNGDNITNIGDVVSYVFVVKNTGNQTLTNVVITDNNAVISGGPIAELAVGQSDSTTFTASHAITQQDIDKGFVYNLALVEAKDPQGGNVTDNSSDPTPCTTCPSNPECTDCTVTELTQTPGLTVDKTTTTASISKVGDIISYTIVVKNTGNVTLTQITVKDPLTGLDTLVAELAPGASSEHTQTYTVTQEDLNKGLVTNVATADGFGPNQTPISATDNETVNEQVNPIDAVDDTTRTVVGVNVTSVNVHNVLINDLLGGVTATADTVNVSTITPNPFLQLNADGTLDVLPNAPAGTLELEYQICEKANSTNCDTAIVRVPIETPTMTVSGESICIKDVPYFKYTSTANNFTPLNGLTLTWKDQNGNVVVTMNNLPLNGQVLWPGAVVDANGNGLDWPGWVLENGKWLQAADGFEGLRPTASVTMTINPDQTIVVDYPPSDPLCTSRPTFTIDAVDDNAGPIDGINGAKNVLNVFKNDTLNTDPLNPADVTLTLVTADPTGFMSMNPDGSIDIKDGTPAGIYKLQYQICENADTGNCDKAWVTVDVICNNKTKVTGVVYNSDTNTPLANVPVNLIPQGTTTGPVLLQITNAQGQYNFTGVVPGAYLVQVQGAQLNVVLGLFPDTSSLFFTTLENCIYQVHDFPHSKSERPVLQGYVWYDVNNNGIEDEWYDADNDGKVTQNIPDANGNIDFSKWEWIDLNGDGKYTGFENTGELNRAGFGNAKSPNIFVTGPNGYNKEVIIGLEGVWRDRPPLGQFGDYKSELRMDANLEAQSSALGATGLVKVLPGTSKNANSQKTGKSTSFEVCGPTSGNPLSSTLTAADPADLNLDFGISCKMYADIVATPDVYNITNCTLDNTVRNPLSNDLLNGTTSAITNFTFSLVSTPVAHINVSNTGNIVFENGVLAGQYVLNYQACETANPTNCARSTITVNVAPLAAQNISGTSYCNADSTPIDLNSILPPGTSTTGTWIDTNATGGLSANMLNPLGLPLGKASYEYKIAGDCPRSIFLDITINDDCKVLPCKTLVVHNALSANEDGKNDYFQIEGIEDNACYKNIRVEVYNRWGVLVFEKDNYNNEGNAFRGISEGRTTISKNEGLPTGTYFYILSYDSDGVRTKKDGYLYLVR